jgi:hypothetical protein
MLKVRHLVLEPTNVMLKARSLMLEAMNVVGCLHVKHDLLPPPYRVHHVPSVVHLCFDAESEDLTEGQQTLVVRDIGQAFAAQAVPFSAVLGGWY